MGGRSREGAAEPAGFITFSYELAPLMLTNDDMSLFSVALRDPREVRYRMTQVGQGAWVYEEARAEQYPFLVRALYFVLFGWWVSFLWMALASLVCSTIVGLPLGIWMFDLVPALVSLQR